MAFLSWLMSQGHGLDQIAQTMVSLGDTGTLAQLYANLENAREFHDAQLTLLPEAIEKITLPAVIDDPLPRNSDDKLPSNVVGICGYFAQA
jgi:hypothetical protein